MRAAFSRRPVQPCAGTHGEEPPCSRDMAKAKEDYLLTTKLFCGKCERMMVGESGKSHTGAMHYYYKCGGAKRRKDCDKKAVRKDWIERVVVRLTM